MDHSESAWLKWNICLNVDIIIVVFPQASRCNIYSIDYQIIPFKMFRGWTDAIRSIFQYIFDLKKKKKAVILLKKKRKQTKMN